MVEGTVALRFQVMDDVELDSAAVYLNGRELQNLKVSGNFFEGYVTWNTLDYLDGNYIVEVLAWDSAGNIGFGVGVVLTVRNDTPRVIRVPYDFETIQDAVWNSEDGDTIMVEAGEYHEQLQFFDKNVSLVSESGPEETIINGAGLWAIVWLGGGQDSTMLIRGFTFFNPSEFQCYCFSIDGIGTKIVNNIFSVPNADGYGIISGFITAQIRNNLFINLRGSGDLGSSWGDFDNNMVINAVRGLHNAQGNGQPLIPDYNLFWNVDMLAAGPPMGWGENNINNEEPIFIEGSYRLQEGSPGIDQGRPDLLDPDGSRADIGVYGGPYAY